MGARLTATLRSPLGVAAVLSLGTVLILAIVAPILWSDDAARTHIDAVRQPPSWEYPLGTDGLGRDVLLRVLVATRLSVELALIATAITVTVGILAGALPALLGRRGSRLVTAAIDMAVAFPGLLVALVLAVMFGVGATGAVLAIGLAGAPSFARLTHTLTSGIEGNDYVAAARVLGVRRVTLLGRHIVPNIAEPLVVAATIGAGQVLLAFAGLSFLGLGVQPPDYDWGRLLNEGLARIYVNPAAALAPGAMVIFAGIAFGLAGEAAAQLVGMRSPAQRRRERAGATAPARPSAPIDGALLEVQRLRVTFPGDLAPVDGVSFAVAPGERIGIVGESGSGKSLTALAIAGLVPHPGRVESARLRFEEVDLRAPAARARRQALGTRMAMVFQDPMSSLNPVLRIGRQLSEVSEVHDGMTRGDALERAVERLQAVGIQNPARRVRQYPHELSGGMRQRVMIATGLMGTPRLIIADEPTASLDVTIQRQVLDLLLAISAEHETAMLLISHDIAVVAQTCERVIVMYAGMIVEDLPVDQLRHAPAHPYTQALLATLPDLDVDRDAPLATIPGRQPAPGERPPGCPFAPRCPHADERCRTERPRLDAYGTDHALACWHPQGAPRFSESSHGHA